MARDPAVTRYWPGATRVAVVCLIALAMAACAPRRQPPPSPVVEQPPVIDVPDTAVQPLPEGDFAGPLLDMPLPVPTETLLQGPRPIRVALLVPLSGPAADVGAALLQAAQMALFDSDSGNVTLVPKDTRGGPVGAQIAARQAIGEGAEVILGPLFGAAAKAVSPIARQAGVPVIAFTNDATAAGGGIYVLGLTPRQQVMRVVGYAREQGISRFAALVPENDYGRLVARAMQDAAQSAGGQVDWVEYFQPDSIDLSEDVRSLAQARGTGGAPYEAVLVAAGGAQLRVIAPLFPYYDIGSRRVRLLGTELWHRDSVLGDSALAGGWFAAPPDGNWQAFAGRYDSMFGGQPPRPAALAYDAVALVGALSRLPATSSLSDVVITTPKGYAGTQGIFRFDVAGAAERALAVYSIGSDRFEVISPAPTSFPPALSF